MRCKLLLLFLLGSIHILNGQSNEKTISGRVFSSDDGEALPGVNVVIKGTTNGTITGVDGEYKLTVTEGNILSFSYVGYKSIEYSIGNRTVLDVRLEPEVGVLDEIVVVAYGEVKRRDLTGSVASVKGEDLVKIPVTSFDQALQGRAAGVQVTQVSGRPGGSTSIRIRGSSSLSAGNEPLYVVDGMLISSNNSDINANGAAGSQLNSLSSINPSDIASIEVLKDASATALYGSRAANGVVLITTKRGSAGRSVINFEASYGVQEVTNTLDLLNGEEFANYMNEFNSFVGFPADPRYIIPELFGEGTDWQEAIFQAAPQQNYQLSISGGDELTNYAISGGYFHQDGIVLNSDFERISFRTNIDRKFSKSFKVGASVNLSRIESKGVLTGAQSPTTGVLLPGALSSALLFPPTLPVLDENGPGGYTFEDDRNRNLPNPVADALETDNISNNLRIIASVYGEYEIIEGLKFKANLGIDAVSVKDNRFVPNFLKRTEPNNGEAVVSTLDALTWLSEYTLNYQKEVGDHSFSALGGVTFQGFRSESLFTFALDFPNNRTGYHNLGAALNPQAPSNGESEFGYLSYLGRVNYNYKGKYLFTLTGRVDGSSKFGENEQYGFFPAAGFAWQMGEEDFMSGIDLISSLKLRTSFGILGNSDIPSFQSLATVGPLGEGTFSNSEVYIGTEPLRLANPDLKWERTAQFDLGFDLALMASKLIITADYYVKNTDDLLLFTPTPNTSGFSAFFTNIGELSNQGFELSIQAFPFEDKEFQWAPTLNFSTNKNEIKALSEGNDILAPGVAGIQSGWSIFREGQAIGTFFGYQSDGIFQSDADAAGSPVLVGQSATAGDRKYRDINGRDSDGNLTGEPDGIINEADRTILGQVQPKFTWGFINDFSYKGFDLSIFIQGSHGNKAVNAMQYELGLLTAETNVFSDAYNNRWTPDNPSNEYQRLNPSDRRAFSDALVEDASFFRIRNVNIGYTFSEAMANRLKLNKLRLYFSVTNILTITDYTGYDPEVNAFGQSAAFLGVDYGGYPLARTIMGGIQIGI